MSVLADFSVLGHSHDGMVHVLGGGRPLLQRLSFKLRVKLKLKSRLTILNILSLEALLAYL